jgi:hypothetical protein
MHRYDGTETVELPEDTDVKVKGKKAASLKPGDVFDAPDLSVLFGVVPVHALTEV